jgi:hypothetical protein
LSTTTTTAAIASTIIGKSTLKNEYDDNWQQIFPLKEK